VAFHVSKHRKNPSIKGGIQLEMQLELPPGCQLSNHYFETQATLHLNPCIWILPARFLSRICANISMQDVYHSTIDLEGKLGIFYLSNGKER
jgi:hypothetical protein